MEKAFELLNIKERNVILCGDFNFDNVASPEEAKVYTDAGMIDSFNGRQ